MAKPRQISFRVPEKEYEKIALVYERAKERTLGYAPLGDVVREAIGLIPLKVITETERDYLAGKISSLPTEGDYFSADAPILSTDEAAPKAKNGDIKLKRKKPFPAKTTSRY